MAIFKRGTDTYNKGDITGLTVKGVLLFAGIPLYILLFFMLVSTVRVVSVGQVGIITRLGQVTGEDQSGLHFIPPWPFASMTAMQIQTQKEQQDSNAATQDLQLVTTTIALNYHLTPATANTVFRTIGIDYKTKIIDPAIQEAVKSTTANYNASELISKRPIVEAAIFSDLVTKLGSKGITVDGVNIVNFTFSPQFDTAIEQKQVAQQQAQQAQYDLQTAQLKAQAQQVQAATLTPEYLQLQAINKWDGHLPTTVAGGSGTILSIPLTK